MMDLNEVFPASKRWMKNFNKYFVCTSSREQESVWTDIYQYLCDRIHGIKDPPIKIQDNIAYIRQEFLS